jgi:hypothetical protein
MKKSIRILLFILGSGVLAYYQFFVPSFSGDEIALGSNLKIKSIWELFYPLDTFQSAPPLYLFIQKIFLIVLPMPFWINIKILSYLVGVLILWFAIRIAANKYSEWGYLSYLWIVLFVSNAYVVHNVLTVKQYGFDLLGVLILFSEFDRIKEGKRGALFFGLWLLLSNVGLFVTAAFLIFVFIKQVKESGNFIESILSCIRKYAYLLVGPFVYVIYFIWFMQQKGAVELQEYMKAYWHWGFFPMNSGLLGFGFVFLRLLGIYFFTSYLWIVYPSLILVIVGLFYWLKNKVFNRQEFMKVALLGMSIHLSMSFLHIYPLADRLYLYWIPVFYWLFILGLTKISKHKLVLGSVALLFIGTNCINLPFKANDVVGVYRFLRNEGITAFYTSPKAEEEMGYFNSFTDFYFKGSLQHQTIVGSSLKSGTYFVSQVNPWYGHKNETAPEQVEVLGLINTRKIKLVHRVDGYNIYRVI